MYLILTTILLFHSAFSNRTGVSREEYLPDFASLCPFSNFCEASSPIQNHTHQGAGSCCQKCSCDFNCFAVGTCCPGVEHLVPKNTQNSTPQYACVYPKQLLTTARNITEIYSGTKYRIVDSCPNKIASERFPGCENPEILSDYVLVSDISNDYVFKNKHCAACNGVVDVTNWTLLITSCPELMIIPFESIRDRNDYILKHCELDASPPDTINVETATCYNDRDIVSKCNISKKWDVYNKALEETCLKKRPTQNTIFKGKRFNSKLESPNRYRIYSNVYCYLCNIERSQHQAGKLQVCETEPHVMVKFGIFTTFSAVLDLRETGSHDGDGKDSQCSSSDIWDPNDNVCRPLLCPIGSMPVYGSCVNFAMSTSGYSLIFFLDLKIHNGSFEIILNEWNIMEKQILEIVPGECGVCGTDLFDTGNISTPIFTMSIQLYTKLHCSTTRVFEYVKSLVIGGALSLKFSNLNSKINISLIVSMAKPDNSTCVGHHPRIYTLCPNPLPIQMHHLQNCRRFMIPIKEFSDFGFISSLTETAKDLAIVTDNAHISICVRTYFKYRESMIKSDAGIWTPGIVSFAVVVLRTSVCLLLN